MRAPPLTIHKNLHYTVAMKVSVTSEFSSVLCMKAATTEVEDVLHALNKGLLRLSLCMQC